MTKVTRRKLLNGLAGIAALASMRSGARAAASNANVIVIGAGVFGAWTARELRRRGRRVLLLDASGPANARASSGGESRMTRSIYGADEVYTRMATESLADWRALSDRAGAPVFHPVGVLMFFGRREAYAEQSIEVHRRLGLPLKVLGHAELARRWPQVDWSGVELGLLEADFGPLMARRAVQTLVAEFVAAGGEYRQRAVLPPAEGDRLEELRTVDGERLRAEQYVFACGPWLPKLFPALLGERIVPTRQEVFFFAPPDGDTRFGPAALPGWAEVDDGDIHYGFPDLESRGFKIAHDAHGPRFDPDRGDRGASEEGGAHIRAYLRRRFPALAERPLVEMRVCQYENSSNGDLLIDRHPSWPNVLLLGAGSGHGFKHGPAVGRRAADLLEGSASPEPRFSLASKGVQQRREVH
jgi:glycine/D-amino acid oxidase-like deaminating enzyme